jgi:hypothetical protein
MSEQSSKAFIEARRKRQALDPQSSKRQRAKWDRKYQETHADEIRQRSKNRYAANPEPQRISANARYAKNPVPILKAALRRYYRLKFKLPLGQTEFPTILKSTAPNPPKICRRRARCAGAVTRANRRGHISRRRQGWASCAPAACVRASCSTVPSPTK